MKTVKFLHYTGIAKNDMHSFVISLFRSVCYVADES